MKTDDSPPCTEADRQAIIDAAKYHVGFLRWLADKLRTTDNRTIRMEAADAIEHLVGKNGYK
jgi:hypothetical protein